MKCLCSADLLAKQATYRHVGMYHMERILMIMRGGHERGQRPRIMKSVLISAES